MILNVDFGRKSMEDGTQHHKDDARSLWRETFLTGSQEIVRYLDFDLTHKNIV